MVRIIITNPFLFLAPLVLLTIAAYLPTASSFVNIWTNADNPTYSHGFLLLGVSIFFVFRTWKKLRNRIRLRPSVFGVIGIILISLTWFIAEIGNIQIVQLLTLLLIIIFLFISILGLQQTKLFLFPLLIIIFAIPIWDFLNIYLRIIATVAVGTLLKATGILSVVEGFNILLPNGTFLVTPGCSGLGQFITALSIGFIYVFMQPMRWLTSIIFIAAAAFIAIITNIIRIYIVVVSGYLTDMQHYFVTVDHVKLGWVVFAVGIFFYLFLANRLIDPSSKTADNTKPLVTKGSSLNEHMQKSNKEFYAITLFILLAISSGPILAYLYQEPRVEGDIADVDLPGSFNDWKSSDFETNSHQLAPRFIGADIHKQNRYKNTENEIVEVNIYYYRRQHQGKEAVNDLNEVFQKPTWSILSRETYDVIVTNRKLAVEVTIIESRRGRKKLVWKWYSVLDVWTSNALKAKLLNIWGVLTDKPEISVFVIATDIDQSYETAFNILRRFSSSMSDALEKSEL